MKQLDIMCDIDGVLAPFHEGLADKLAKKGFRNLPTPRQWEMWHDWNMTIDQLNDLLEWAILQEKLWVDLPVYDGAVEFLDELHNMGHRVHLVTARMYGTPELDRATALQTLEWVVKHNLHVQSVHRSDDKDIVRTQVAFDDSPGNVKNLHKVCHPAVGLWHQPWNETLDVSNYHGVERISNYEEALGFVERTAEEIAK